MTNDVPAAAGGGFPAVRREIPRLRHLIKLISSYFVSREWPVAIGLLTIVLLLNFGHVRGLVATATWQKSLFDTLGNRDAAALPGVVIQLLVIYAWITAFTVFGTMVVRYLGIRWRTWLTNRYLGRYVADTRAYEIEQDRIVDNPDQRIAEDIRLFTDGILTLVTGFFSFIVGAISYTLILWQQSETAYFSVFGTTVPIPADLVVYAYGGIGLFYAMVYFASKPLVRSTMRLQKVEADFRFRLTNIRRAAEQIAFLRAASGEYRRLTSSFARVRRTFVQQTWAFAGLETVQGVMGSLIMETLPLLATLPRYFTGTMTIGDVAMSRQVFVSLLSNLSWPTQAAASIAQMAAIVNRLHLLDEAMARPETTTICVDRDDVLAAGARNLTLTLPTGEPLLRVDDWQVKPGERWAITGENGGGKSTLLRALAGLWRYGAGSVVMDGRNVMFVPQKLYMPDGTLKDILAFPQPTEAFGDEAATAALQAVGMGGAVEGLHDYRAWGDVLSPGQQQLASFARILLHRPDLLFLDEATSALDPDNAIAMYDLIRSELPDVTLVSIVHDPRLLAYHNHRLTVSCGLATTDTDPAIEDQ